MGDVLEVKAGTDRAPAADRGSADVVARAVDVGLVDDLEAGFAVAR